MLQRNGHRRALERVAPRVWALPRSSSAAVRCSDKVRATPGFAGLSAHPQRWQLYRTIYIGLVSYIPIYT